MGSGAAHPFSFADSDIAFEGKPLGQNSRLVREKLNGSLASLQKQTQDIWINIHRQTLLTFARECRHDVIHSADEWAYVLNIADEYEQYCDSKNVPNGVVRADTRYLRDLYLELSREHKI